MAILIASQKLFSVADVEMIHAYVKSNNRAAIRAFVKAGFQKRVTMEVRGHEAVHFGLRRDAL
jgi:RimJ/RimL family protein N-acetyltransferase